MANGDRWSARYDHAIREGWPNAHSPKPPQTEDQKRELKRVRMQQRRADDAFRHKENARRRELRKS